ncbi:hypothetical protein V5799_018323 [Amblyomma americanum]|uniref:Uncharacterized protein n=1 Tax=Amblyomma americanum TaxID=6943 RepID=A0AAQ4EZS3_AMBAM
MDSVKNSREYEPALSPCGSMDQLLHLSTEEQAMDVESINTSGEINESLLFLDEDDIEEESSDYNTSHGSTKSKDRRAKNSLKDEKHAEVSRISIKEEKFSTTPEFTAQDSTISKGIWNPIKIKKEPGAENEKDCSSKSLDCSNTHDMVMVNFEDEDAREIKVEPILENTGSAESLHISAVEGYVEEEECNEKPVDAVAVERLADKGGDSANTELGGGVNAAAVDLANSGVGASIPEDSNLIVLTRQQLELYVMLRMRQCLVAEHNAQKLPFEKKYCALQRSLVRWRCRALQLKQQLQDLISADNRQAGLHRRPQQVGHGCRNRSLRGRQ